MKHSSKKSPRDAKLTRFAQQLVKKGHPLAYAVCEDANEVLNADTKRERWVCDNVASELSHALEGGLPHPSLDEKTFTKLMKALGISKTERQYKHILRGERAAGKSKKAATRVASAVVNKRRAALAKAGKGPKLISKGGSRRQWYPGKEMAKKRAKVRKR